MNPHFVTRSCCPCCGAPPGPTLFRKRFTESPIRDYLVAFYEPQGGVEMSYLEEAEYILVDCPGCGLIYQQQIAGPELMSRLYDRWIDPVKVFERIDSRQDAAYFFGLAKQIANAAATLGRLPADLRVLDFGMGWGHWCRMARGFGCQVSGCELSAARIAYAQQCGLHVLPYDQIPAHRFDLINTEQVFEHIPEPYETLLYLKQAIAPGGMIRLSVPEGWGIKAKLRAGHWLAPKGTAESLNVVAPLEHINCFNHHVIVRLAERAGLRLRTVPDRFTTSLRQGVRDLLKPLYYRLRGRGSTGLYFSAP